MNTVAFQLARICLVIALVCVAAALATPKGRLPLALRGLAKMVGRCEGGKMRRDKGSHPLTLSPSHPSAGKRALAFALVIFAVILALI